MLVEAAIAVLVVAISIAGVFALAKQCMMLASEMDSRILAAQIVESEMERLRAMPRHNLAEMGDSCNLAPATALGLSKLRQGKGVVEVTALPGEAPDDPLRMVSVRVTWVGMDGRAREMAMGALLYKGEAAP